MVRNPLFFQPNRSFDFGKKIINMLFLLHTNLYSIREGSIVRIHYKIDNPHMGKVFLAPTQALIYF